jgi:hypothetical protein
MLLPALGSARQLAKRLGCLNNLKQTGQGVMMYVADYNEYLPPTTYNGQFTAYLNYYFNVKCDYWSSDVGPSGAYSYGLANKKPSGAYFYCPALPVSATGSPTWTSGATPAAYYWTNYVPTRSGYTTVDASLAAGWSQVRRQSIFAAWTKSWIVRPLAENNYSSTKRLGNQATPMDRERQHGLHQHCGRL